MVGERLSARERALLRRQAELLPPCAKHGESACGACYTLAPTDEELGHVTALHVAAEQLGAVPPGDVAQTHRLYRLRPPRVIGLRGLLRELARALHHHGGELAQRVHAAIQHLDAVLQHAGRSAGGRA